MTMTAGQAPDFRSSEGFSHEALFYAGLPGFVEGTSAFIREGIAAGEPVLVVVSGEKIARLRRELGPDADRVEFADMNDVGLNPARIIPAWTDFVNRNAGTGRRFRGIGEPIWAERTPEQLVECERHEALLNLAFADTTGWRLLCPYDTESLSPEVLDTARENHPGLLNTGETVLLPSATYLGVDRISRPFDEPLEEPEGPVDVMTFSRTVELHAVRGFVRAELDKHGIDPARHADVVLAVNEIATNSCRYGGGRGVLRAWAGDDTVVFEIRDEGRIDDPLVGRRRPEMLGEGRFGMWLVTQVADLVQIRTFDDGAAVRLHFTRA